MCFFPGWQWGFQFLFCSSWICWQTCSWHWFIRVLKPSASRMWLHSIGTLSFLSFAPPAEPTCSLPFSCYFKAPSHALYHGRWSAFLSHSMVKSCICQSFHQCLHDPHARAFSGNLFSSVKVCSPLLCLFPSTLTPPVPYLSPASQPLHYPSWMQVSPLCLPTPKPQVPASNDAHILFFA